MTTRRTRLAASALLAAALLASFALPAHAATTTIKPATLERGANPAVASQNGTTIVDGEVSVRIDADEIQLLGPSLDDYVVVVYDAGGSTVERVSAAGEREVLVGKVVGSYDLSHDGERLLETRTRSGSRTVIKLRDAVSGNVIDTREFKGFVSVLDARKDRVVLGGYSPSRTFSWNSQTDATKRISKHAGYFADLSSDRLGVLTGDVYDGGCSVLSSLSRPGTTLWRSCEQAVIEASPDGSRLATVALLQDGPLGAFSVHDDRGRLLDTYRATGSFGRIAFEDDQTLLITAYGQKRGALVRCDGSDCERASRLVKVP